MQTFCLKSSKNIVLKSNGIKSRFYALEKHTQKLLFTNSQITAAAIRKLEDDNFVIFTNSQSALEYAENSCKVSQQISCIF